VPQIKPHGTHAVGYVFNNHEAGITVLVQAFMVFSSDGYPRVTRDILRDDQVTFQIRRETLPTLTARPLASLEKKALALPAEPVFMESIRPRGYEPFQAPDWTAPFRAPWFPDDIHFRFEIDDPSTRPDLPADLAAAFRGELVWGRMERVREDGLLECILLNQPSATAGYNVQDLVIVRRAEAGDGDQFPVCMGHATDSPSGMNRN
jgi:hypothetical protein